MFAGAATLGFEFIAKIADKNAVEIKRQFGSGTTPLLQFALQKIEHRSVENFGLTRGMQLEPLAVGEIRQPHSLRAIRATHEGEASTLGFRRIEPERR